MKFSKRLFLAVAAALPVLLGTSARADEEFWPRVRSLTRDGIFIFDRLENALNGSDRAEVDLRANQLVLYSILNDNFLEAYADEGFNCDRVSLSFSLPDLGREGAATGRRDVAYCTLQALAPRLEALGPVLLGRSIRLPVATAPSAILPGVPDAPVGNRDYPTPEVAPIGSPSKPPTANYEPPLLPAIKPPSTAEPLLAAAENLLRQTYESLPETFRFSLPEEVAAVERRFRYDLYPHEPQLYAEFLAQPNTGITRVLPAQVYIEALNPLGNRLAEEFSLEAFFPIAVEKTPDFSHRLNLQIVGDRFQIAPLEFDYGFFIDLGEVPLADLSPDLLPERPRRDPPVLPESLRQFVLQYRPPQRLEAIQADELRFIKGDPTESRILATVPVELNHTYLLRSVQYRLPDFIKNRELISRRDRRTLAIALDIPSSDLLIALQPVDRRIDGSYTVLWRVLRSFPDPPIVDLHRYADYY